MEPNFGSAYNWYGLAEALGYESAAERSHQVCKQLAPAQRAKGQQLAAEWWKKYQQDE